jgi:Protein of unknown function (DUF1059)
LRASFKAVTERGEQTPQGQEIAMARMMVDCRDMPSESNCTLAIAGDDVEDLLDAAVLHAVAKHGHEDGPELREAIRGGLKPVEPAMA